MAEHTGVTLADVAAAAGVSAATASRVLNGTARVRAELRERVLAAAERLAYSPNALARALASASSPAVGVIGHDVADPYFAGITRGVMRAATRHDLHVILGSTFRDPDQEISYTSMLRGQRVRAVLLVGSGFEDRAWQEAMRRELDLYRGTGGRIGAVSRHPGLRIDSVLPDNRGGAGELARALLALGHREFAVLAGPPALTTVVDRLVGFREALAQAGIDLPEDRIVVGEFTRDGGHRAARELLRRHRSVTCVFAMADVMAAGALTAFRGAGLRVPEDISLAGFDDIPLAVDLTPALTTVALPLAELGERALELALLPERASRPRVEQIRGEVVLRASSAPLENGIRPRPRTEGEQP
ncbi:LacI family transcriptional regulator [Nocardia panacis]|uniref:LacI family transcriptional regulator n=1 Tax=Nocardia panacis TaxID=2340916 RepID=A0A3A4K9Z1_9NOCA|nr:LacI family DNA-binding transcriptional regulator [Nocardia panacis]RJO78402.1 LacI family transcriptional regulator [Nocardia panacis]